MQSNEHRPRSENLKSNVAQSSGACPNVGAVWHPTRTPLPRPPPPYYGHVPEELLLQSEHTMLTTYVQVFMIPFVASAGKTGSNK